MPEGDLRNVLALRAPLLTYVSLQLRTATFNKTWLGGSESLKQNSESLSFSPSEITFPGEATRKVANM